MMVTHHEDARFGSGWPHTMFTGRFWGRVWNMDCVLELRLDDSGQLQGVFDVEGEVLEVALSPPDPHGALRGVIRAHDLAEAFATFRARPDADGLFLEVNMTESDLESEHHVPFARIG